MAYDHEEQEQLASLSAWWKRYGNLTSWVLIVALAGYSGWAGWQYYQRTQAAQAAQPSRQWSCQAAALPAVALSSGTVPPIASSLT